MLSSIFFKTKIQPVLIALGIFLIATFFFCQPTFEGKVVHTNDGDQFNAMVKNMYQSAEAENGQWPIWNRSLFAGMPFSFENIALTNPAFQFISKVVVTKVFLGTLGVGIFNYIAVYFWLACLSFYILCSVLGFDNRVKIIASLIFSFSLQMSVLVIAGHHTKLMSLALLPLLITGFLLLTQKRYYAGTLLAILALYSIISYEHYQMVFYCLLTLAFIGAGYLIHGIKNKINTAHLAKVIGCSLLVILITGSFAYPKLSAYQEYSKETIRSGTKIFDSKAPQQTVTNGLDKSYAFKWSYGVSELLTFFSPDAYGGTSSGRLDNDSKVFRKLVDLGVQEDQATNITKSFSTYWGDQVFTLGPVYFGVLICIFVILYFVYVGTSSWLLTTLFCLTLCCICIGLGSNFSTFNYFIFDHLPLYNKFRAPSMVFTMLQFSLVLIVACALQYFFIDATEKIDRKKILKIAAYTCGGLIVVLGLFYLNSNFKCSNDDNLLSQLTQMTNGNKEVTNELYSALQLDRASLVSADIIKMIVLSALLLGLLYAYSLNKIKPSVLLIAIGCMMVIDNMQENMDYLNKDSFQESKNKGDESQDVFPLTEIDKMILQDKDPNYRVLDITSNNVFTDASTSYHHRSVGGYYAAKLSRYQDLIDSQLNKMNSQVLNMLNTKYVIVADKRGAKSVQQNPSALGAAWFVNEVKLVDDTKQEMKALDSFNPKTTAVVEKSFQQHIPLSIVPTVTASIVSMLSKNDTMKYVSENNNAGVAVFSEIFYDKTWQAFIDDKPVPTIKANYVLRALSIPSGKHNIAFINSLKTYEAETPSQTAGSVVFIIFTLLFFWFDVLPRIKQLKLSKSH